MERAGQDLCALERFPRGSLWFSSQAVVLTNLFLILAAAKFVCIVI
jgi:hypothetical protein